MMTYYERNLAQANNLPMPEKSYTHLNVNKTFTNLTVRPGLINKHVTAAQLHVLAQLETYGALKYSANHSFLLATPNDRLEQTVEALTAVGLYAIAPTTCAIVKCCDFCDGDKQQGLPLAMQLIEAVEQLPLKQRIRIGFNACTLACYNAVQDDIAVIFHKGHVDIYAGAITMGRRAAPSTLLVRKLPQQQAVQAVQFMLSSFEASPISKFATFIAKHQQLRQQLLEHLKGEHSV